MEGQPIPKKSIAYKYAAVIQSMGPHSMYWRVKLQDITKPPTQGFPAIST